MSEKKSKEEDVPVWMILLQVGIACGAWITMTWMEYTTPDREVFSVWERGWPVVVAMWHRIWFLVREVALAYINSKK